jgi:methionine-rich copper-binding protein CopC
VTRIRLNALLAAILGGLLWVGPAQAHADYGRSEPGAGAIVSTPPARVDVWFTQALFRRQGENRLRVLGPDGQAVQMGEPQIDDDDRTHMWVQLQPGLAPGVYTVEWRTLSADDGDTDEGQFAFTVDPQAVATTTPPAAASATATRNVQLTATPTLPASGPTDSLCGVGAAPAAGVIALILKRRARR